MKPNKILPLLLTTEQGCRLATACTILFALLALTTFLSMLSAWWGDLSLLSFPSATAASVENASIFDNELTRLIPEAHLFGFNPPVSSSALPLSSTQYRLMGVIKTESSVSKAIISSEGKLGKVYQEGDILPGGFRLTTINSNSVILDNGGQLERLPLARTKLEIK